MGSMLEGFKVQVAMCFLAKNSTLLAQRAMLAWRCASSLSGRDHFGEISRSRCFLAWRVLAAQQRSGEQKEMLDLIESSNGWILHLQRERWSYEEQLQAADLQIQELQEALEAEEKSKEALLLQLQQLQEHRTHRPWLRAVEPVAVQQ